jgi:glycerol uptake facilitator-like aquaporin
MQYFEYLSEFIGSLFIVFVIVYSANPVAIGAAIALVYALAKTTANPAETIAVAFYKQKYDVNFDMASVIPIVILQCLGGLVAIELYKRTH